MSGGGEIPKLSLSVRSPVTTEWPLFSFITHLRPPAPEARWLAHKLLAWVTYSGWFLNSLGPTGAVSTEVGSCRKEEAGIYFSSRREELARASAAKGSLGITRSGGGRLCVQEGEWISRPGRIQGPKALPAARPL